MSTDRHFARFFAGGIGVVMMLLATTLGVELAVEIGYPPFYGLVANLVFPAAYVLGFGMEKTIGFPKAH